MDSAHFVAPLVICYVCMMPRYREVATVRVDLCAFNANHFTKEKNRLFLLVAANNESLCKEMAIVISLKKGAN
jgi:hypothetical protein